MKAGTLIALIDPDVHKQANIVFTLSADKLNIQWEVKGLPKKLAITDIKELRFGSKLLHLSTALTQHKAKKLRYFLAALISTIFLTCRSRSSSATDLTR